MYGLKPASAIHWSGKTGNASIVTTTADLSRWVDGLLADRLLKPQSREAVFDTSQESATAGSRARTNDSTSPAYYMNETPERRICVLRSHLPRGKSTVVVFSNIYSSATTTIGYDIAAMSLGQPVRIISPSEPSPVRPN